MKRLSASVMAVAVVLVLIAFVAPSSAYSISNGQVMLNSPEDGQTTWTFDVEREEDTEKHDISHFVVAWCNKDAVKSVTIYPLHPMGWEYGTFTYDDPIHTIRGIKVELGDDSPPPVKFSVKIILDGLFAPNGVVNYIIKADNLPLTIDTVNGPSACNPIPEFSTIAIPIASILGLLFFFNHRKRREEE